MAHNLTGEYRNISYAVVLLVFLLSICGCDSATTSNIEPRVKTALVEWQFTEDKISDVNNIVLPQDGDWTTLKIPHVFRLSGLPDEAAGWYKKTFDVSADDKGKRFYLYLEGAATVKDVFVNGEHIGKHRGAYTAAAFDLTDALKYGQPNTLLLRVSNRDEESADCLSRSTLYYINGGLYRKAWLIKTDAVHIYPDMGSCGVYIKPENITSEKAELKVKTVVSNPLDKSVDVIARHTVTDPDGKQCAQFETQQKLAANEKVTLDAVGTVSNPKLWDTKLPNPYTVRTELLADGQVSDKITERTGFRTITMKDKKFYLNGKEFLVRGVNKHHQNEHEWNALSDDELRWEWEKMIEMGVNTVRLAHYPHSRLEYSQGDENGIAIWAENGLAGQLWNDRGGEEKYITTDGERITREMVRQNFNHPSILFWSSGNETIQEVASRYAAVIREEDDSRLVTFAANRNNPEYTDFVAFNTYDGWYGGHYTDFNDRTKNTFISETGAGSWVTHHIPYGEIRWQVDVFEPEEYTGTFAEYRLQKVCVDDPENRPMFLWWNFREFYNLKFKKNRTTKGILTLAGMPKDIYYLFQSFFDSDEPVLHLCGRHYFLRKTPFDNGIKVYSDADEVELILNGESMGKKSNGDFKQADGEKRDRRRIINIPGATINNVFFFKNPLKPGRNLIEVSDDRGLKNSMVIYQLPADANEPMPVDEDSLVVEVASSNPDNPAFFIDRPVESQGPFYYDVDGSSDNTFDRLPSQVEGSTWIATRRLSTPTMKTDLSFKLNEDATVYVLYSTGTYPKITLRKPNGRIQRDASLLEQALGSAGFEDTGVKTTWRGQDCVLEDCALWSRSGKAGETITIPGQTLDYVILIKP